MNANDKQIGGEHYKAQYQHWDFVCDTGMHYLLGCATKYVSRWRKKNGVEDLKKSLHYIEKAIEEGINFKEPLLKQTILVRLFDLFCGSNEGIELEETDILEWMLLDGNLHAAKEGIEELIKKEELVQNA